MSQPNQHCIGIDVAKLSLDIAGTAEFAPFSTGNDDDGFMAILKVLKDRKCSGRVNRTLFSQSFAQNTPEKTHR